MAGFLAVFNGGPVNLQVMTVHADPELTGLAIPLRPARWQEFRKTITDRLGASTGRVGVFLYQLQDRQSSDDMWSYEYHGYGEAYDDAAAGF